MLPCVNLRALGTETVEGVVNAVADFCDDLCLVLCAFAKSNQDRGTRLRTASEFSEPIVQALLVCWSMQNVQIQIVDEGGIGIIAAIKRGKFAGDDKVIRH